MKKTYGCILAAALMVVLTACSVIPGMGKKKTEFEVGEAVSTYWFDFTVNQVETVERLGSHEPAAGNILLVCHMTLESTFEEPVPMNWADFVLLWETEGDEDSGSAGQGGMDGAYPLERYSDEQLPDEYKLEKDEVREGSLVFEVPQAVTGASVVFQELYAEGDSESEYSEGDYYTVYFEL